MKIEEKARTERKREGGGGITSGEARKDKKGRHREKCTRKERKGGKEGREGLNQCRREGGHTGKTEGRAPVKEGLGGIPMFSCGGGLYPAKDEKRIDDRTHERASE